MSEMEHAPRGLLSYNRMLQQSQLLLYHLVHLIHPWWSASIPNLRMFFNFPRWSVHLSPVRKLFKVPAPTQHPSHWYLPRTHPTGMSSLGNGRLLRYRDVFPVRCGTLAEIPHHQRAPRHLPPRLACFLRTPKVAAVLFPALVHCPCHRTQQAFRSYPICSDHHVAHRSTAQFISVVWEIWWQSHHHPFRDQSAMGSSLSILAQPSALYLCPRSSLPLLRQFWEI